MNSYLTFILFGSKIKTCSTHTERMPGACNLDGEGSRVFDLNKILFKTK